MPIPLFDIDMSDISRCDTNRISEQVPILYRTPYDSHATSDNIKTLSLTGDFKSVWKLATCFQSVTVTYLNN